MINCIAVDDEPLALKLLQDNISKVPFLKLVGACNDPFEAMKALQENKIDLVFIDIQMPGLTGLQFIGSLENEPLVIFITAYKQYELESYDLSVRTLKTDLDLRPIYHKNDDATMAHLHLGLLAYWLVNTIRHQLKQSGINDDWKEIKRKTSTQKSVLTTAQNSYDKIIMPIRN